MFKPFLTALLLVLLSFSLAYAEQPEDTVIPIDAKLEYNNALDMYKLGKYEDSIACLRTAIRLCPE